MTFHEEMNAKQAAKDKKCKQRVHNYMEYGKTSKACTKCNHWKHKDFTMTCTRFSREVFLHGIK